MSRSVKGALAVFAVVASLSPVLAQGVEREPLN